ncbi:stage 0 sporulation family protein [Porcipelethomonas ammoniilytica]|jgi:cell fate regulator YaaT (PSP1 superfamily)|uniref:PSP1 domain-containing protein n=3 Tax=Porcipelethomonas TaxID=2981643 RepID=UPI000821A066|nr:stage 0 sporulation family protein [Porcipelethomonas ammoniilytica]MBS1324788.1 stage 0 sporulation family protein [Oscillospiraceae bacterium]MBS6315422.1 stage 0 sporulation family protein [Ruminococcus sp.]OLA69998.1 MAG: stage 0 sporulation protein [Ruminococcus sp. 37_24]SCI58141.1 PSP1 C-terminal conserved region [uncultured Ruminococcus sp.]MCU6718675.1 stage 0 sporulation family protein [Porcipelethomonas ammoniilytica]
MVEIIGVRFKQVGKIYYFSPKGIKFDAGDHAIVETVRGVECGEVVIANRNVDESEIVPPLKEIIRKSTAEDMKIVEKNHVKEKEAFDICLEKIAYRQLNMHLIDVECTFDNNKILFYFTAENRVDFRELVKDLAAVFRTRIELRQIGVRDEAKILGGLGICGREFCCKRHLGEFQPVSIKMAKEQGLSLNPSKISGTCGRLMCCLKNEQSSYEELLKITPKVGAFVKTPECKGYVEEVNLITGKLKIKPEKTDVPIYADRKDVKVIKDAEIRVNKEELKALKDLEKN